MALSSPPVAGVMATAARERGAGNLRVPGRWLPVARALWLALLGAGLALTVVGLPGHVARLHIACDDPGCASVGWYLSPAGMAQVRELGLPLDLVAVLVVGVQLLCGMVYTGVSALIVWRRAGEWLALITAFALLAFGLQGLNVIAPSAASNAALALLPRAIGLLGSTGIAILLYFLPDGRFRPRWLWWAVGAWTLAWLPSDLALDTPLNKEHWPSLLEPLLLSGFFGLALGVQLWRFRRVADREQRQQAKWVVYGLTMLLVAHIVILPAGMLIFGPEIGTLGQIGTRSLILILFLLVPISIGIAILRHRLWDIDLVIRRTLVYGVLTACVVALYGALVIGLGTLFRGQGAGLAPLLATALVAVLFQPLRDRLQRGVNRLLYGERDDPYAALSRLGQRLEGALVPGELLPTIVGSVREALKLPYAAVALAGGPGETIASASGTPVTRGETLLRVPLLHGEERVGELRLAPRTPGEQFAPADRRLLAEIARQAGVAIHAARLGEEAIRLNGELQASRERLVATREEERRRLRRDLHDGLGPQLAGFTLRLDVARNLLARDPEAAGRILADLSARTQEVMADIRRLVYALRPPALDERGLVGALRQHAESHPPGSLRIAIVAPDDLPPLPAAVEVAAYRIAQEAATNAARHANAATCTVTLALADHALTVTVADDGTGIAPDRRTGIGLHSMRERAEEIGGWCVVGAGERGGTTVKAALPIGDSSR
jgi:signal transduction histidine kinase